MADAHKVSAIFAADPADLAQAISDDRGCTSVPGRAGR